MSKKTHDAPLSFRASPGTRRYVKELAKHWGESMSRTIARAIANEWWRFSMSKLTREEIEQLHKDTKTAFVK